MDFGEALDTSVDFNDFTPIEKGDYIAQVTEIKEGKYSNGQPGTRLNVAFTILKPKFANRKVFTSFNIIHSSKDTMKIARMNFARLAKACGVQNPTNSDQVLMRVCGIKVDIEEGSNGTMRNEVKGYFLPPESDTTNTVASAPVSTIPPAGGNPWD